MAEQRAKLPIRSIAHLQVDDERNEDQIKCRVTDGVLAYCGTLRNTRVLQKVDLLGVFPSSFFVAR